MEQFEIVFNLIAIINCYTVTVLADVCTVYIHSSKFSGSTFS